MNSYRGITSSYWRNMSKQRLLLIAAACLHLLYVLAVNIASARAGYRLYYQAGSNSDRVNLNSMLSGKPQQIYGFITGTMHGYGFFAPNVASQYVSQFTFYDEGKIIAQVSSPGIRSVEGLQRYSVWLDQFQRFLREKEQDDPRAELYRRYLKASVTSLCRRLLADYPAAVRIKCQIYLHRPPLLQDMASSHAGLVPIYDYSARR
ncbi:hypothetical protein H8S90_13875 [Olivibacter sp. SDN3]|uniref:hypothetical protein n=1 Tax=Olivibacter sp. SDN3 TaxID=2764720 RepID=UPI0016519791|nr:hypothetical protein [Olivibacter sp. SDN3]QNL47907.1 hypothetical protein H8S90_13875 [Olivibacter sp. SDN3]